jgi:hypothetical protein
VRTFDLSSPPVCESYILKHASEKRSMGSLLFVYPPDPLESLRRCQSDELKEVFRERCRFS